MKQILLVLPERISHLKTSKTVYLTNHGTTDEECELSVLFGAYVPVNKTAQSTPDSSSTTRPFDCKRSTPEFTTTRPRIPTYQNGKIARRGSPKIVQCGSSNSSSSSTQSLPSNLPVLRHSLFNTSPSPMPQIECDTSKSRHARSVSSDAFQVHTVEKSQKSPEGHLPENGRSASNPLSSTDIRGSVLVGDSHEPDALRRQLSNGQKSEDSDCTKSAACARIVSSESSCSPYGEIIEENEAVYYRSSGASPGDSVLIQLTVETDLISNDSSVVVDLGVLAKFGQPTSVEIDMSEILAHENIHDVRVWPDLQCFNVHNATGWITGRLPCLESSHDDVVPVCDHGAEADLSRYPCLLPVESVMEVSKHRKDRDTRRGSSAGPNSATAKSEPGRTDAQVSIRESPGSTAVSDSPSLQYELISLVHQEPGNEKHSAVSVAVSLVGPPVQAYNQSFVSEPSCDLSVDVTTPSADATASQTSGNEFETVNTEDQTMRILADATPTDLSLSVTGSTQEGNVVEERKMNVRTYLPAHEQGLPSTAPRCAISDNVPLLSETSDDFVAKISKYVDNNQLEQPSFNGPSPSPTDENHSSLIVEASSLALVDLSQNSNLSPLRPSPPGTRHSSPEYDEMALYDLNAITNATPLQKYSRNYSTRGGSESELNVLGIARRGVYSASPFSLSNTGAHSPSSPLHTPSRIWDGTKETSSPSTFSPQYNSVAKFDFTPPTFLQIHPILTCFFVLTFTDDYQPSPEMSNMTICICGPKHTTIMMARIEDESVPWEFVCSQNLDSGARSQFVEIPHSGFAVGQALCLVVNCALKDFNETIKLKLPNVYIAHTKPSTEDFSLAKVRCPLFSRPLSENDSDWLSVDDHSDGNERWKFKRANITGRAVRPMTIQIASLPKVNQIAVLESCGTDYIHRINFEINGNVRCDDFPLVELSMTLWVHRHPKSLETDPLISLRAVDLGQIMRVEVNGFPAQCFTGLYGDLLIMDNDHSSSRRQNEILLHLFVKGHQQDQKLLVDLPCPMNLSIQHAAVRMKPDTGSIANIEFCGEDRDQKPSPEVKFNSSELCFDHVSPKTYPKVEFCPADDSCLFHVTYEMSDSINALSDCPGLPNSVYENAIQVDLREVDRLNRTSHRAHIHWQRALMVFVVLLGVITSFMCLDLAAQIKKMEDEVKHATRSGADLQDRFKRLVDTQVIAFQEISKMQTEYEEIKHQLTTMILPPESKDNQDRSDCEGVIDEDATLFNPESSVTKDASLPFEEIFEELESIATESNLQIPKRSLFEIDPAEKAQFRRTIKGWFSFY